MRALSVERRARASMALAQARGVNLRARDEPANHLDLPARSLPLVSHDRQMLACMRPDQHRPVEDGLIRIGDRG